VRDSNQTPYDAYRRLYEPDQVPRRLIYPRVFGVRVSVKLGLAQSAATFYASVVRFVEPDGADLGASGSALNRRAKAIKLLRRAPCSATTP
jgi:hypothetical protein